MPKTFGRPKSSPLPPSNRILDYEALRAKGVHFSRTHLRRLWERGDFPPPFHTSHSRLAWRESAIDAWIAEKEKAEQKAALKKGHVR